MNLTGKQTKAAALLAQGAACKEAAKQVGVSPQTLSAWKKNPEFEAYLNHLKWETLEHARDTLRELAPAAIQALSALLAEGTRADVRRRTAIDILTSVGLFGDPQVEGTRYGWGIGPTDPRKIARRNRTGGLSAALDGLLAE